MQAHIRPARHGWLWVRDAFALWRKNPALLTFLVFSYWLVLVLIGSIPYLGQIAMTLAMPPLSVGIYNGCRAMAEGRRVGPETLFSGFRQNLPEQLKLGALYFTGTLLILGLISVFDGGAMAALMLGKAQLKENDPNNDTLLLSLMAGVTLSTPLMMAYWFAPLLCAWGKLSAPKAMFFSLVACWRNWRPFLYYACSLMGLVTLAALVLGLIGLISPLLAALPGLVLPAIFMPICFASFYTNAMDIFGSIDAPRHIDERV
jgi:hypothetical protein